MNQSLFVSPKLEFKKIAAEAALPEDPNAWSNEVLQELFKQVPYIAEFEPAVVMDKVDAERGYAFGHIEVSNKTEIQPNTTAESLEAAGIKHVKIPIVVRNRKLQPFDIMINETGELLPLTETRLRGAIFRPSAFDITGKTPGDLSMVGQLYPPFRQNFGFGGGGQMMSVGMGKEGASNVSLLSVILPTINEEDYAAFLEKISEPSMQAAYVANQLYTKPALDKLAKWELGALPEPDVTPTIVQVSKMHDGYQVKSASHYFYNPKVEVWDRGQVVKTFGIKLAFDVDTAGSSTMSVDEPKEAPHTEKDKFELIKEFGMYKVRTDDGKEIVGYVFPNLIDVDGTPLPLYLFTNGSEKAIQGDMVGVNVGGGASIPEGPPQGSGCFFQILSNGRAQATIPMSIVGSVSAPDQGGAMLHARTFDGRPIEVEVQPNITNIMGVGEQKMLIPETMGWLPLDAAKDVSIVTDEDSANAETKMASANPGLTIEIRSSGPNSFSLSGMPLEKLAGDNLSFLTFDEAIFLLGAAGADLAESAEKLAQSQQWNAVYSVQGARGIITDQLMMENSVKLAQRVLSNIPDLRQDLVKEAAVIPDPTTVDTVLSLGFINPENLRSFIAYLPKLDTAQKKMCELLLASRLGMKDLPSSALEKAIRSTEDVISGLKVLAFQDA